MTQENFKPSEENQEPKVEGTETEYTTFTVGDLAESLKNSKELQEKVLGRLITDEEDVSKLMTGEIVAKMIESLGYVLPTQEQAEEMFKNAQKKMEEAEKLEKQKEELEKNKKEWLGGNDWFLGVRK